MENGKSIQAFVLTAAVEIVSSIRLSAGVAHSLREVRPRPTTLCGSLFTIRRGELYHCLRIAVGLEITLHRVQHLCIHIE